MEARKEIYDPSLYETAVAMASILDVLHHQGHFIPRLVLNDFIAVKGDKEEI